MAEHQSEQIIHPQEEQNIDRHREQDQILDPGEDHGKVVGLPEIGAEQGCIDGSRNFRKNTSDRWVKIADIE